MSEQKWKGKTRGGMLGYKIFVFILKTFGLSFAYFILFFVSFYFIFFSPKSTKAAYRYFRDVHHFGFFKTVLYLWKNYYKFGQTLLDKVAIMSGADTNFTCDFDGEEHLHDLVNGNNGGIMISAHMGNWEVAGHFLYRIKNKINIVLFDGEHQQIKAFLDKMMGDRNTGIIVIKSDFSHIIPMSKALKNNEFLCIHGDRFLEGSKTLEGKIMGRPALFPSGPFALAQRFKVPYTFVFAFKESKRHYHFYASKGKVNASDPSAILAEFNALMDEKIKEYPDQWFNFYDFWAMEKKQPATKSVESMAK